MIEVSDKKLGDETFKTFTILCDGFVPKGYVQMECRLSDMKVEGEAFFIDVFDETTIKHGDYSPLTLEKHELKQFIDYLEWCHKSMP